MAPLLPKGLWRRQNLANHRTRMMFNILVTAMMNFCRRGTIQRRNWLVSSLGFNWCQTRFRKFLRRLMISNYIATNTTLRLWEYVPQEDGTETAEKTAKLCMKIFAGIGANVAEFDIDTAHRVPARNSRRRQASTQSTYQPIICKFTRRIARDGVLAKRREIRRLTPEIFGLPTGTDLRISIYCHLIPRLQELLHSANLKTFQEENSFKYCWAKDAAVFLRKTENSRIFKLSRLEDLEELRCNATSPTATEIR